MAQSLAQVYLHVVFSTYQRAPKLFPEVRNDLHAYLGGILRERGCSPVQVGGTEDHVHLLFLLGKEATIAGTIRDTKASSSAWLKPKHASLREFSWQAGYSAFSVEASRVEQVSDYIAHQEEHHRRESFQDELRRLLSAEGVPFSEQHLWTP